MGGYVKEHMLKDKGFRAVCQATGCPGSSRFAFHSEKDLKRERQKPDLSYILGQKIVDLSLN
jgi:hypothetical protein